LHSKCAVETSHSILTDYPPARNRDEYASIEEVEAPGVRILDGKVTCISWHNLQNPSEPRLGTDARDLCQICHIGI
jgi:hypothetical protein